MPFLTRLISSQLKTLPPLPDVDLTGHVYIVTGSNCGIGLEIARHLVQHKATTVILAVRNVQSGETAHRELQGPSTTTEILVWNLDLADFSSVAAFAEKCKALDRLDGVVMNAGMLSGNKFTASKDGHELTTQVNVLSPTYLSLLLLPILRRSATQYSTFPRIIFTGSAIAEMSPTKHFNVEQPLKGLDNPERYTASRYEESKLVLHTQVRKLMAFAPDVIMTDVNPGFVNTPLYRAGGPREFMAGRIGRTPEVGARNVSMALLTLKETTDWYHDCRPCKIFSKWLDSSEGKTFGDNLWSDSIVQFQAFSPELTRV